MNLMRIKAKPENQKGQYIWAIAINLAALFSPNLVTESGVLLLVLFLAIALQKQILFVVTLGASFSWAIDVSIGFPGPVIVAGTTIVWLMVSNQSNSRPVYVKSPIRRAKAVVGILICLALFLYILRGSVSATGSFLEMETIALLAVIWAAGFWKLQGKDAWNASLQLGTGMALSLFSIYFSMLSSGFTDGVGLSRRFSVEEGVTNYLSVFAIFVSTLWCILFFDSPKKNLLLFSVALFSGVVTFHIVIGTGTRSVLIGFCVFILMLIFRRVHLKGRKSGDKLKISAIGIVVLTLLYSIPSLLQDRVQGGNAFSGSGRDYLYEKMLNSIVENPVSGVGGQGLIDASGIGNYAHNLILDMVVRYGLILGIFLSFVWMPRIRKRVNSGFLPVLLCMIAISLLEPSVETVRIGLLYVVLLAIDDRIAYASHASTGLEISKRTLNRKLNG